MQACSRRCVLTGETLPPERLIRLVPGPDGVLAPDLKGKLPGRGLYVQCHGPNLQAGLDSGAFYKGASRALKQAVRPAMVPDDLVARIDRLLARQVMDRLGLERRAGHVLAGFDTVRAALKGAERRRARLLIAASDAAPDGRRKLAKLALAGDWPVPLRAPLDRDGLSAALGRDNTAHILVLGPEKAASAATGAEKLLVECDRLMAYRDQPRPSQAEGIEG
ncbi:DUF448 domain-containing protein [Yunchengibacter salinarum]|uniref:DUF448 domain-containing protein n=1 Tax=Yunchengibacter salinarum TaxID=3133399 RepID=UPI0035B5958F